MHSPSFCPASTGLSSLDRLPYSNQTSLGSRLLTQSKASDHVLVGGPHASQAPGRATSGPTGPLHGLGMFPESRQLSVQRTVNSSERVNEAAAVLQDPPVPNTGRGGVASVRSADRHNGRCLGHAFVRDRSHCLPQRVPLHFGASTTPAVDAAWRPRRGMQESSGSCRLLRRGFSTNATTSAAATHAVVDWRRAEGEVGEGSLVEYKKDQKSGLALVTERDGKRNWKAVDTRGTVHSLRPQQIAYVLPGGPYKEKDLHAVDTEASAAADKSLMELAWELISEEEEKFYNVPKMAELLFEEATPITCYASHRLLTEDRTYFKQAGRIPPVFTPRSQKDVATIKAQLEAEARVAEEKAARLKAFKEAIALPREQKPSEAEWLSGRWASQTRALLDFALQIVEDGIPVEVPKEVMETMQPHSRGVYTPLAAQELLKQMGVWAPHQHLAPLRAGLTNDFGPQLREAAEKLLNEPPPDPDAERRVDLTHLEAWAIDSQDTTEVDDAVGLEVTPEGVQKLWVHVADPTRWLHRDTALDSEAQRRTASLYLPTGSVSMFPRNLAEGTFSLRPDEDACALSIWVVLDPVGGIADCGAECTTVRCRRVTYDALEDTLKGDLAEDSTWKILNQAAQLRRDWRMQQGAVHISMPECEVRVKDADSATPHVFLTTEINEESAAHTLVSELMIMANEAVARIGATGGVPLPYRGQAAVVMPSEEEMAALPPGPCRQVAIRSRMTRSVCTTSGPLPHAGLGLQGYVQATSPIRRYTDLLAHWQLKAKLRGEEPPLDAAALDEITSEVYLRQRDGINVMRDVSSYWRAEYFSRERLANPSRVYPAILLSWIREEVGFGKALLDDYGLEVALRINRPAKVGETLHLRCSEASTVTSEITFVETQVPSGMQPLEAANPEGSEEVAEVGDEISEVLKEDKLLEKDGDMVPVTVEA